MAVRTFSRGNVLTKTGDVAELTCGQRRLYVGSQYSVPFRPHR